VAGLALDDIHLQFAWQAWQALQAWHLATSTFTGSGSGGALGRAWSPGAPRHCLCVAGVALGGINRLFAWQAWRLGTSTFLLHGRRGTGVALDDIDLLFACQAWRFHLRYPWQAWRLLTSTFV